MDAKNVDEAIELGSWLGRKQAFGGMAGRCSAADAHCLLTIREEKKYKTLGLTWEEFCPQRLGISRAQADKTIRLLEEFGETYFYLNGLAPVSPEDYRLIAGAVEGDGVQYAGELIPIAPQNAARLAEAVGNLKRSARLALPAPAPDGKPGAARKIKDPIWQATRRQTVVGELEDLLAGGPGHHDRATLVTVLGGSVERLRRLDSGLR
jgi:hypothetical protein